MRSQSSKFPLVTNYGRLLSVSSITFDPHSDSLTCSYSIVASDEKQVDEKSLEQIRAEKEEKRLGLRRGIEFSLSVIEGWEIKINVRGSGEEVDTGYTLLAEKVGITNENEEIGEGEDGENQVDYSSLKKDQNDRILLRFIHSSVDRIDHHVRVKLVIHRLAGGSFLRVNSTDVRVNLRDPRDLSIRWRGSGTTEGEEEGGKRDVSLDLGDEDGISSFEESGASEDAVTDGINSGRDGRDGGSGIGPGIGLGKEERGFGAGKKEVTEKIRRSYIYFTSLLQVCFVFSQSLVSYLSCFPFSSGARSKMETNIRFERSYNFSTKFNR
jgi:hypothetical protein